MWEFPSLAEVKLPAGGGLAKSGACGADANALVTAHEDSVVKAWNLVDGTALRFKGHRGVVLSAAASPDGKRVASAGGDGTVRVWAAKK